jgi:hypothetical protein
MNIESSETIVSCRYSRKDQIYENNKTAANRDKNEVGFAEVFSTNAIETFRSWQQADNSLHALMDCRRSTFSRGTRYNDY